jgi:transcriptional regulator with XRE-family HTH domain
MQKKEILSCDGGSSGVSPSVSKKIILHLVENKGIAGTQIAKWIGSSRSFVSHVKRGEKNLTIDKLLKLEEGLKQPLPLLFMDVVEKESMSKELKDKYKSLQKAWKELSEPD